jgi:hypothetical protein
MNKLLLAILSKMSEDKKQLKEKKNLNWKIQLLKAKVINQIYSIS